MLKYIVQLGFQLAGSVQRDSEILGETAGKNIIVTFNKEPCAITKFVQMSSVGVVRHSFLF